MVCTLLIQLNLTLALGHVEQRKNLDLGPFLAHYQWELGSPCIKPIIKIW